MSRRRFTIEELEEIAVKEKLTLSTRRSLLLELDHFVRHGILLAMCLFKRSASEDLAAGLSSPGQDRLLRPERAAETLGVSRQYFYDHEEKLPYVVRLSNGILRVSEKGMFAWIEERMSDGHDPEEVSPRRSRAKDKEPEPEPTAPPVQAMPVRPAPAPPVPRGVAPDWMKKS